MTAHTLSYRDSGVDIDAGDELVERIKKLTSSGKRSGVLGGIGGFGGLFELPVGYRKPVLVSGADGVGTKLKLAFLLNRHDDIGQDLVAMCVNDILVQGAEPLFFLDYFACGHLEVNVAERVIAGIARACDLAQCALIGGETAEMPGMYPAGEYDLAGFAVGIVEKDTIITGAQVVAGDAIIGLASNGAHANGYSLIRKIIEKSEARLDTTMAHNHEGAPLTLSDWVMRPTRLYARAIRALISTVDVKALVHITGGGLLENIPRSLPGSVVASLTASAWPRLELFSWLQETGNIEDCEMHRVFNCGLGMIIVVAREVVSQALALLKEQGESAWVIGEIIPRSNEQAAQVKITP